VVQAPQAGHSYIEVVGVEGVEVGYFVVAGGADAGVVAGHELAVVSGEVAGEAGGGRGQHRAGVAGGVAELAVG